MRIDAGQTVLVLATLASSPAFAEGPGKVELTALYSFLSSDAPSGENSFHGHRADLTVFPNRHLGLGATLVNSQSGNHDLLFGPEFALLEKGRIGVRLHARAGGVQRSLFWIFATSTGTSLDIDLGKGWIWRLQPEIVWWRRDGTRTDFRFSTGTVVRWGRRR